MKEINRTQVLETLEKALRDAIECEDTLTFSVAIDGETGEAYEWNCVCPLDCPESVYKGKDIQIVRFEAEKYSTFSRDENYIDALRDSIPAKDILKFENLLSNNESDLSEFYESVKQQWSNAYEEIEDEDIAVIIEDEDLKGYLDRAIDGV